MSLLSIFTSLNKSRYICDYLLIISCDCHIFSNLWNAMLDIISLISINNAKQSKQQRLTISLIHVFRLVPHGTNHALISRDYLSMCTESRTRIIWFFANLSKTRLRPLERVCGSIDVTGSSISPVPTFDFLESAS